MRLSSLKFLAVPCLVVILCKPHDVLAAEISLASSSKELRLSTGPQTWRFSQAAGQWSLAGIEVQGIVVAQPSSLSDSFWVGAGKGLSLQVLMNSEAEKAVRFSLDHGSATYRVRASDTLPLVHVELDGSGELVCAFCSKASAAEEHGAWVTRGWVATDADDSEAFIDASNPLVFGHSMVGDQDTAYTFVPEVQGHVQRNGRTEQRTGTLFKAERRLEPGSRFRAAWQLRLGEKEPKAFAALFDRNLGGRLSDVCEKYFAPGVDMLLDISKVPPSDFDPEKCLEMMPVRLAAPDAFVPGWGLMMGEFQNASYPFAHDSVWQVPALLTFEGLATGRNWEHNFARYFLDKTPLEGPDGKSFFVRRPGGLTRWSYFATYRDGFVQLDGGTWWQADILYHMALALKDNPLREAALDMVKHDLNVKLDLEKMTYPPCWSPVLNRVSEDHRDDWFMTPGLAYCSYMAARVAYPETRDPKYLAMADRICEWFASYMVPESKLNNLQGKNMHAVFSHYLALAFIEKYERSHEKRFLDMARDMAWIHIMTTCTTPAKDNQGHSLTGTTCVGIRGCVDYDCAPNLCHEKDLTFVHIIGPLLDHVSGPAYGKYLALCRLVLAKDSWPSAWDMELRDTNLRTMYDTYARGMANLIYALNRSSDPWVGAVEKLVSKSDLKIGHERDLVVFNGTPQARASRVEIRFLEPGSYDVELDGAELGEKTHVQLAQGLELNLPANSMRRIQVHLRELASAAPQMVGAYDSSVTWLSDLTPFAAQRGTGLPVPIYRNDRNFDNSQINLAGTAFDKGLGCAANTVIFYQLDGKFDRFAASCGVDRSMAGKTNPPPSVFFTAFVDGKLVFESGPMFATTPPCEANVDVRHARMLMLRMSCNWDDNGKSKNDQGDWAKARLIGKRADTGDNETFRPVLSSPPAPIKVILDTDNGTDCGDAGAVAVLHALADRGELEILGVMACTSDPYNAPCLDAYNAYFGRPDIPVGTLKDPDFLAGPYYTEKIAKNFPNALKHGSNAPDATALYRRLLAAQPEKSVVVIAIGPLRNLRKLLQSGADTNSPLSGRDLVSSKVRELSCMAGWIRGGSEFNLHEDGESAHYVGENWPTPIMFSGAELGWALETGQRLVSETPPANPVRTAYGGGSRPSWDQTSVFYAARGLANYWGAVTNGYNQIDADGNNIFLTTTNRHHSYLIPKMNLDVLEKIIEDLMVGAAPGASKPVYPPFIPEPLVPLAAEASPPEGGSAKVYQAAQGEIGGGAVRNSESVGDMHHDGAYVKVSAVDGGKGGRAWLKIRFATHDNALKGLYINDTRVKQIKFRFTGGWNTFKEVLTEISLKPGGDNAIMIKSGPGDNGWGVNLACFTVFTY